MTPHSSIINGQIAEVEDMGLSTCNLAAKLEYMSDS